MIFLIALLSIVFAYLLGSIPTGYLIVKILTGKDIREIGSGNIGATNVKRAIGLKWFFVVLFLDALKGFIPVFLISTTYKSGSDIIPALVGLAAILGHTYTIFLKFKGGKGVATGLGVFLSLAPISTISCIVFFIVILFMFNYISLGSITSAFLLPIFIFIYGETGEHFFILILALLAAIFVIYKHKENIKRLMQGTENKFRVKEKEGEK